MTAAPRSSLDENQVAVRKITRKEALIHSLRNAYSEAEGASVGGSSLWREHFSLHLSAIGVSFGTGRGGSEGNHPNHLAGQHTITCAAGFRVACRGGSPKKEAAADAATSNLEEGERSGQTLGDAGATFKGEVFAIGRTSVHSAKES